jgi:hypothetical protein
MEKKVKDLAQGDIIIVKDNTGYNTKVHKIEVLEKTKTSIYYEILDTNYKTRIELKEFDNFFSVIEFLYNKDIEELERKNKKEFIDEVNNTIKLIKKNNYNYRDYVKDNPLRQIYPDWTVRDYFRWNDKTDITITYR